MVPDRISSNLNKLVAMVSIFMAMGVLFILLSLLYALYSPAFWYQVGFFLLGIVFLLFSIPLVPNIMRIRASLERAEEGGYEEEEE